MPRKPKILPGAVPLDPSRATAAIRALAEHKTVHHWSYVTISTNLFLFGSKHGQAELEFAGGPLDWEVDENTLQRSVKSGTPPSDAAAKAIYFLMKEVNNDRLEFYEKEEELNRKETLVKALREALGHDGGVDHNKIKSFSGGFKLYRPSHIRPLTHVMICSLNIGGDSPFDCMLTMDFTDEFGDLRRDVAIGKIVPHGPKIMAILTGHGVSHSSFIMHFDEIDVGGVGASGFGGVMIAASGTHPASAWPVYARRLRPDEAFKPHKTSLADMETLPEPVRKCFKRGAIHWRDVAQSQTPMSPPAP